MTRVFLTGGSGLIGGALADAAGRARRRGGRARALRRGRARARRRAARAVVRGDVLDEDALAGGHGAAARSPTTWPASTRCARRDPAALFHVNVRGAEAAVRAAARAGRRAASCSRPRRRRSARPTGTVGSEDSPHRGSYLSVYERSKHEGELAAFAAARRAGRRARRRSTRPRSRVPGRAGGTGRILIAYLNGRLRAFVDTQISIVDIADCVEGHVLAAERGAARRALRASAARRSASREALEHRLRALRRAPRRALPAAAGRARGRRGWSRRALPRARQASRRSAARWCARCCTATATTARAPTRELGLRVHARGATRSGARSSGRARRASCTRQLAR